MLNDDEEPHDWEMKDEEPPGRLQKKWENEEASGGPQRVVCTSCKKETPSENLTCIYCGAVIRKECCPVSCLFKWVKRLFEKDR